MPNYDYQCSTCGHRLEISHKISENPDRVCPQCKKLSLERCVSSNVGIAFYGDGFYKTMYGQNKETSSTPQKGECCPCGKDKKSCSNP